MKIAIEYLENDLKFQQRDLDQNRKCLDDKTNDHGMNEYLIYCIELNKKAIESLQKAVEYLKQVK